MNRILPLSPETISQIRSSKEITCLTDVVVGLIENSLDASATTVDIVVNFSRASCTVDDNGNGILPADFSETGGLGKSYHTSKANTLDSQECYGGTGSFLASLAASALLKIVSHHCSSETSNTLVLHHGKVITRQSQARELVGLSQFQSQGTQVEMRDLFGNMPVRVKQRAAETIERHQIERLWMGLKRAVAALLLAWPRQCTVKLTLPGVTNNAMHAVSYHSKSSNTLTRRNLNRFGNKTSPVDPRDGIFILYEAGLAISDTRSDWVPLLATAGSLSVRGSICKHPVPTRQCQFLSIGIHPCRDSDVHSQLYDAINRAFVNSNFAVVEDTIGKPELQKERHQSHTRQQRVPAAKHFNQKRGLDRWPMFVLQIRLSDSERHKRLAVGSTDADIGALMDLLDAAAVQWLTANRFQSSRRKRRKRGDGTAAGLETYSARSTTPIPVHRLATAKNGEPAVLRPQSVHDTLSVVKLGFPGALDVLEPINNLTRTHQVRPFSAWSRIKSGRNMVASKRHELKRPWTMPEMTNTSGRPEQESSFGVPIVEAGQYNSDACGSRATSNLPLNNTPLESFAQNRDTPSSDDYGSIDEMAMCTAAESARLVPGHGPRPSHAIEVAEYRSRHSARGHEDDCLDWINPKTGDVLSVSCRTGIVLPNRKQGVGILARHAAAINISIPFAGRAHGPAHTKNQYAGTTEDEQRQRWLPGFLKDWENPVFQHQLEDKIPLLSVGAGMADPSSTRRRHPGFGLDDATGQTETTKQLSKISLQNMEVISQVDRKFILCKITEKNAPTVTSSLVMVDQHAASERVILETLLAELCTPINSATPAAQLVSNLGHRSSVNTIVLDSHLRYEVSKTEHELFVRYADLLASWGVLFDAVCSTPPHYRIVIRTLPSGISNRCTLVPGLLMEALRTELWRLSDSPGSHSGAVQRDLEPETTSSQWIKLLGTCPRGIIDMLNSRACRSAIMFNDFLDLHQCEELIDDLKKCAFPFICAHGRNSMVPLIDLGQLDHGHRECSSHIDDFVDANEGMGGFPQAFKAWKGAESRK